MIYPSYRVSSIKLLIIIFLFLVKQVVPQDLPFSLDSNVSSMLFQFGGGKSIWVDVNNDDLTDLILSGVDKDTQENMTKIYFNSGVGNFSLSQTLPFGTGSYGDLAAGDVDNDGDLDLIITGGGITVLMINENGEYFWDQNQSFPGLLWSTAEWGDIDNDGDLDLFLMGLQYPEQRVFTRIYMNDPLGILTVDETQILAALANGDAAFGDYDNDGDLDLVVGGQSAGTTSRVMKIYKNEPTGRLIEDTNQELIGLKASSVVWADIDTDGDLDLITTGWDGDTLGISTTIVYRNEPVGTLKEFFDSGINFGVSYGSISAGDLDSDGDVDLLITGADTVNFSAEEIITLKGKLFKNDGRGVFQTAGIFPWAKNSALGEFNHDGKPDIFLNGLQYPDIDYTAFSSLYVNQTSADNQLPDPPENLSSFAVGNRIILSWTPGADMETATEGLGYTLRLGTTSEGHDIFSGIVPFGTSNIGFHLMKVFQDKYHGTYYWSVRSFDQGYQSSLWSIEDSIPVSRLVESIQSLSGVRFNTADWNDYNGDGRLDLALTGISFALGDTATRLFKNEPPGLLTQDLNQDIESVTGGSMAWGDYDNDGFLDFILSGLQGFTPITLLYRWSQGSDLFIKIEDHNLPNVWGGSQRIAWLDYNLDGFLDLLIGGCDESPDQVTGCPEGHWILEIYSNQGGTSFLKDTLQNISPLSFLMLTVNDVDKDGFIDFAIAGTDSIGYSVLKIYKSDSTGKFFLSELLVNESPGAGAMDWGDFNGDGYPDLAVTGLYSSGLELKLFSNMNGNFSSSDVISLEGGVYYGSLDWGDYDNDGDLDLAIAGNSTVTVGLGEVGEDPITRVWINDGGSFTKFDTLAGAGTGTVRWGDYDGDGDLDLLVAGIGKEGNDFAKVFDNLEGVLNENKNPNAPFGLLAKDNVSIVELSWSSGQDVENSFGGITVSQALTYSVRVGTSHESDDILSGADPNGDGRLGAALTRKIVSLEDGMYYWQVRTVDQGHAVSNWSSGASFFIDTTPPVVDTLIANFNPNNSVVIVVEFQEQFGMDILHELDLRVTHPGSVFKDTLLVSKLSFSGNVWTGTLTLPEDYPGQSIKITISNGQDLKGNKMETAVFYRSSPFKILASHGGTIISEDGQAILQISPNSFAEDVIVTIVVEDTMLAGFSDSGWVQVGSLYRVIPDSLILIKPAVLKIYRESSDLDFTLYETLSIVRITGGTNVIPLGGTKKESEEKVFITTSIDSFGTFGLFGSFNKLGNWTKGISKISCQPRMFSPGGSLFPVETHILYTLSEASSVSIRVFNPAGRLKRTIVKKQEMGSGRNAAEWDGRDHSGRIVNSGLYIIVIEAGKNVEAITVGVLNK